MCASQAWKREGTAFTRPITQPQPFCLSLSPSQRLTAYLPCAGLFYSFVEEPSVRLIGLEAGGHGVNTSKHAATLTRGSPGVLHGSFSYLLQTEEGQVIDPHSISAGYVRLYACACAAAACLSEQGSFHPIPSWVTAGKLQDHAITDQRLLQRFTTVPAIRLQMLLLCLQAGLPRHWAGAQLADGHRAG